jgi:hypothetical protein
MPGHYDKGPTPGIRPKSAKSSKSSKSTKSRKTPKKTPRKTGRRLGTAAQAWQKISQAVYLEHVNHEMKNGRAKPNMMVAFQLASKIKKAAEKKGVSLTADKARAQAAKYFSKRR